MARSDRKNSYIFVLFKYYICSFNSPNTRNMFNGLPLNESKCYFILFQDRYVVYYVTQGKR